MKNETTKSENNKKELTTNKLHNGDIDYYC